MWQSVHPTQDWVNSNLPKIVSQYAFNKVKYANDPDCDIDFETMRWIEQYSSNLFLYNLLKIKRYNLTFYQQILLERMNFCLTFSQSSILQHYFRSVHDDRLEVCRVGKQGCVPMSSKIFSYSTYFDNSRDLNIGRYVVYITEQAVCVDKIN